jgi:hypothetical protein
MGKAETRGEKELRMMLRFNGFQKRETKAMEPVEGEAMARTDIERESERDRDLPLRRERSVRCRKRAKEAEDDVEERS